MSWRPTRKPMASIASCDAREVAGGVSEDVLPVERGGGGIVVMGASELHASYLHVSRSRGISPLTSTGGPASLLRYCRTSSMMR
jgi:hypothetical protein